MLFVKLTMFPDEAPQDSDGFVWINLDQATSFARLGNETRIAFSALKGASSIVETPEQIMALVDAALKQRVAAAPGLGEASEMVKTMMARFNKKG